jgi:predicted glutamine amidotransferase
MAGDEYLFSYARRADEDVTFDFSQLTTSNDPVAAVATEPLAAHENSRAFEPGESRPFQDGGLQQV